MKRFVSLSIWIAAAACGRDPSPAHAPVDLAPSGRVLVFRQADLFVAELGVPRALPVTEGSAPSADRVEISPPGLVEIDGQGRLIARRNGRAALTARTGGSRLEVHVRAVSRLRVEPERLSLLRGAAARVRLLGDGAELDARSATWVMRDPSIASARDGEVRGAAAGSTVITALYGGLRAEVQVAVGRPAAPLSLSAARLQVRVGEVEQVQVIAPTGGVSWSSSDEKVLQSLQGGLFLARAPGGAKACAAVGRGRRSCIALAVTR